MVCPHCKKETDFSEPFVDGVFCLDQLINHGIKKWKYSGGIPDSIVCYADEVEAVLRKLQKEINQLCSEKLSLARVNGKSL